MSSLLPMASSNGCPAIKKYAVGSRDFTIDKDLTTDIKEMCKRSAVTPFMLMESAVSALLYRLTGDQDIVIGIPDGDRGHSAFDSMVGFTVNMLAIRSQISGTTTYLEFLVEYRKTCLGAYEHRIIPFDYLPHKLKMPRRTSHNPVFQVSVNYQMQGALPESDFGDFRYTKHDHYNARTQIDLGFEIEKTKEGTLHCVLDFDTSLYGAVSMDDLASLYNEVFRRIVRSEPSTTTDDLNLVSAADEDLHSARLHPHIYDAAIIDGLKKNMLFLDIFDPQVEGRGDKVAVMDATESYTYLDLDANTKSIAGHLMKHGINVGDRVPALTEHNADMILGMYGIVKSGTAYVPIDPDSPKERIASMIADTGLEYVTLYCVGIQAATDEAARHLIEAGPQH